MMNERNVLLVLGFFDLTFTCCSSWLMVFVAFERFCAVWLPHQNKILFTHRKIFYLVVVIVFISTILSTWFIFVVKMITKTRPAFKFVPIHFPHQALVRFYS